MIDAAAAAAAVEDSRSRVRSHTDYGFDARRRKRQTGYANRTLEHSRDLQVQKVSTANLGGDVEP